MFVCIETQRMTHLPDCRWPQKETKISLHRDYVATNIRFIGNLRAYLDIFPFNFGPSKHKKDKGPMV